MRDGNHKDASDVFVDLAHVLWEMFIPFK